jgi:SPP1 family predicted phage head-tail adaptor
MQAGKRRTKLELQRVTTSRDSYGEPIETWTTYSRPWVQVVEGAGAERIIGKQEVGAGTVVVLMNYQSPLPVISERGKLGTRTFDINNVVNVDQKNHEVILTCTEVTG